MRAPELSDPSMLDYLACPVCRGSLRAEMETDDGGQLLCEACNTMFPVVAGIPRLQLGDHRADFLRRNWDRLSGAARRSLGGVAPKRSWLGALTSRGYSENWRRLYEQLWEPPQKAARFEAVARRTFNKFVRPGEIDEAGVTLEVGVGLGRFLRVLHRDHPKMQLVGIDLSDGVDWVGRVVGDDSAAVVQGDILNPPFRAGFADHVLSFGVLHHTPDPQRAFRSCWETLRGGGSAHVWLYGDGLRQNSPRLYRASCSIRRWHSRLPPVILWRLCWLYGVVSWTVGPVKAKVLPFPYRISFADGQRFWMDNLVNPFNFVYDRPELVAWRPADAEQFDVEQLFGGWVIRATRNR